MNNQIFRKTSILALFTLLARILGFVRDIVIAQTFGATATVDAFVTANKVLSSFRGFVESPVAQIFVPVLSDYRKKRSHEEEKRFIAKTAGTLCLCVLFLVCFGMLAVPYIIKLSAPGFDPYRAGLATHFLRLTFPYLFMISFCGIGVAVMNTYDRSFGMAVTPIWLSISFISAAYFFSPYFAIPITALAWGVLFGGVIQVLFVMIILKRLDLLAFPRIDFYDPSVRKVLKSILPAALGASAAQVSMMINTNLSSYLPIGTASCIYFADRLIYFPLSVIGISLSHALLRPLSKHNSEGNKAAFADTLGWGLRANILVAIPASIMIAMLAGPLIMTLLMQGEFTASDVLRTKKALLGYVPGVSAFMLAKIFVTAFYTRQDTRTPIIVVVLGAFSNVLVAFFLLPLLQQAGVTLANSINAWVQVLLMVLWLQIPLSSLLNPPQGFKRWMLSILCMTIALIGFLYVANPPLETWFAWSAAQRYIRLTLIGLGTFAIVAPTAIYSGDFKQVIPQKKV